MNAAPAQHPLPRPHLLALAVLSLSLAGCTAIGDLFGGDKVDYRNTRVNAQPLDVPPDLSQLSRESRYQTQGGAISAAAVAAAGTAAAAATPGTATTPVAATAAGAAPAGAAAVAISSLADMRIERQGQQRWLVVAQPPEVLWPRVLAFWSERGFAIAEQNAQAGVMETNWNENRAKLPKDAVRNVIGGVLGNLYDTGERDRFRTRIERTAGGSEVYITHRGAQEVLQGRDGGSTTWTARPNDPELEAEMLARLMVALGAREEPARAAVTAAATPRPAAAGPAGAAAAATAAAGTAAAARAPGATPTPAASGTVALVLNEGFDRAWRRVGVALDRSGFTVEDRDRSQGVYFVRYVDPKSAGKDEPGWWARLFGDRSNPQAAVRYRIAVRTADGKSTVSVHNSAGVTETGENAQRIMAVLERELR